MSFAATLAAAKTAKADHGPEHADAHAKVPSGIAGVRLGEIERQVPARRGAAAAAKRSSSRSSANRCRGINGRAKVTGAARFTVDIKLPGMLHAALLRSPYPHARIVSIDTKAAERHPGVRAVHVITGRGRPRRSSATERR